MSHRLIMGIFAAALLILAVALFVPTYIDAANGPAEDRLNVTEGESANLTDRLSVGAQSVNVTGSNATIQFTNEDTLATNETNIAVGDNATLALSGDNLTVGLEQTAGNAALVNVSYPPTFGWDSGPRTFVENLELVFAIFALVIVLAGIVAVIRS